MKNLEINGQSDISGQIYFTNDYDKFNVRADNRIVSEHHVKQLMSSIKNHDKTSLNPIMVNSNYEIIDGQHRFHACKNLDLPIYYIVDNDFQKNQMIALNTSQKNWSLNDYLRYYMQNGSHDYIKLKDFMDDVGFPLSITLKWIANKTSNSYKQFKVGGFKFQLAQERMNAIIAASRFIEHLKSKDFKPISVYYNASFHEALMSFFLSPLCDVERFFDRLEKAQHKFHNCMGKTNFLKQLLEIYNYEKQKDRLKIIEDGKKVELTL